MGLVMSEFLSLDDKIKKARQAGCLMNRLKMAFGTTGDDPDPEVPMQRFKNFRNAGNDKGFSTFPKHLVILCVPLFPSLFGEERSETHVDENTGDTPSLNETDVREILFRKFGSEFPEHPPVRLKKKRFGIDKNAVIVKKNGFQHVPLLSSSTFPVNSLRYSSGEVRYFSRNRREK